MMTTKFKKKKKILSMVMYMQKKKHHTLKNDLWHIIQDNKFLSDVVMKC